MCLPFPPPLTLPAGGHTLTRLPYHCMDMQMSLSVQAGRGRGGSQLRSECCAHGSAARGGGAVRKQAGCCVRGGVPAAHQVGSFTIMHRSAPPMPNKCSAQLKIDPAHAAPYTLNLWHPLRPGIFAPDAMAAEFVLSSAEHSASCILASVYCPSEHDQIVLVKDRIQLCIA